MDVNVKEDEIKHEVVAAYNEVLRKLKLVKNDMTDEEKIVEEELKEQQEMIAQVVLETPDDLVRNLSDLKLQISRSLEVIKSKLLPQYEKFHTLRQAIDFSERELNELYNIKVNINTLNALLGAQKEKQEAFEIEISERRRQFDMEMAEQERARLQEEHDYITKRDAARKIDMEQYENHKREAERELEEKRRNLEDEFEAREARLAARESEHQKMKHREAQITAREQEFKQLKERAMRYPEELRQAVQQAEQSVREQIVRKYEYEARLAQIEIDSERKMYQQKISALEEQIEQYKTLKQMFSEPSANEE